MPNRFVPGITFGICRLADDRFQNIAAGHPPNCFDHPVPRQLPVRLRRQLWRFTMIRKLLVISHPFRDCNKIHICMLPCEAFSLPISGKTACPPSTSLLYHNVVHYTRIICFKTVFCGILCDFTTCFLRFSQQNAQECFHRAVYVWHALSAKKQGTFTAHPVASSNPAPQSGNPPSGKAAR